jgi:hypothetical protein
LVASFCALLAGAAMAICNSDPVSEDRDEYL